MQDQSRWPAPSLPRLDGAQGHVAKRNRFLILGRRLGAAVLAFARELDHGMAVMHGKRPPEQPRPAELDTLARTRVLRPPYRQR